MSQLFEWVMIQAKGVGRIDIEDGYFNNVLFVPDLAVNLLLVYQMTHNGEAKCYEYLINIIIYKLIDY